MSSLIIRPEVSEAAEKAKRNARQNERRRIALALLPTFITQVASTTGNSFEGIVDDAICCADALIEATKVED